MVLMEITSVPGVHLDHGHPLAIGKDDLRTGQGIAIGHGLLGTVTNIMLANIHRHQPIDLLQHPTAIAIIHKGGDHIRGRSLGQDQHFL